MPPDNPSIAHIGVAVSDLSEATAFYQKVLGAVPKPLEAADGAAIVSLPFGDVDIELLEPQTDDGPVAKFIKKRGPGIHHICFRVPDLDSALQRCRDQGPGFRRSGRRSRGWGSGDKRSISAA